MGYGNFSSKFYDDAKKARADKGIDDFVYTSAVHSGAAPAKVHDLMNPKGATREARDSADHPAIVPAIVFLDETGSMGRVVRGIQQKLGLMMTMLVQKGVLPHPAICFCGVGDARTDRAPLQVGQFEADNKVEQWLNENLFIESGGGGQFPPSESYGLGLYFAARHTAHDAFDKRGRPGYLFMIGDEQGYPIARREVEEVIGDRIESDISIASIMPEVRRLYNPFFIIPRDGDNGRDPSIEDYWVREIGREHVRMLDEAEAISETIVGIVATCEGVWDADELETNLRAGGASTAIVKSVRDATAGLSPLHGAGGLTAVSGAPLATGGASKRPSRL